MVAPRKWFASMAPQERYERAAHIVDQAIDQAREIIAISECNRFIIYSPTLASQIPTSYAANAFNIFQWSSLNYEMLRICALWDRGDSDRESIPAIADLVDDPQVEFAVALSLCKNEGTTSPNHYVRDQLNRLRRAVVVTRLVERSGFRKALRAFRDERLAHSLTPGATKSTAGPTLKYGYERRLLRASIAIINAFNGALRDNQFMFDMAYEQSRRNAEALWGACRFNIQT